MKRILSLFMVVSILLSTLLLVSCQPAEEPDNENRPIRTVVELNENKLAGCPLITQGRYHNINYCKFIRRGIGGIADI